MRSDYQYLLALLDPVDFATLIALVAVMLIFNREKSVTMREAFQVMLGVGFTLLLWGSLARGMAFEPWIRYVGIFVICGVCLYVNENFTFPGSVAGATVLLVANVGCTKLMA